MMCVAFVTYNTVGGGLSNGWHEGPNGRRALVLQNTTGSTWFAKQRVQNAAERIAEDDRVRDEIGNLWDQLQKALPNLDHIVVYVGSSGSERAIGLAAQLPAQNVTFVLCDCGIGYKLNLIRGNGLANAQLVPCECGGHGSMRRLYDRFMRSDALVPQPAVTC